MPELFLFSFFLKPFLEIVKQFIQAFQSLFS
ncbi:hypothetical protein A943_05865 [Bacillus sp. CPSM8]|nr:hypothetical protein A943_05865 [Bacillus sp. CPSM8]KUL12326.1 hypothetical protein LI7559_09625 [Bacillus licheniformis LMG 7559]KUL18925.1 hypothetical protein LI6934_03710 [Bacillus licheniformis LMG 6934]